MPWPAGAALVAPKPADILGDPACGTAEITIVYSDLEEGGQILFTTEDAALVAALHAWFDQQVADHGAHAQSG